VLGVLLNSDPYGRRLLPSLHRICVTGRAAALGMISRLNLARCQEGGVVYRSQLVVLQAAVNARALTLHTCQLEGLMGALEQQQQQQQQQQTMAGMGARGPKLTHLTVTGTLSAATV
jgi:hypothetical protein